MLKIRHFIPWIPIAGILYVMFFTESIYNQYGHNSQYMKYVWGSRWAYESSGYINGLLSIASILFLTQHI